jgi:AraC-like DNA-binding protein
MHATKFVESYFDAWNHRDPVAVADHLASDGLYCDIPENAQRTHDELIVYLRQFFSNYRHQYELLGEILESQNTIAFQYRMYPHGKAGKGESQGTYHGAEFVTLHGDAAATITDYYDIPGVSRLANLDHLSARRTRAQAHKYAKSGLSSEQLLEYKERLRTIMQTQQLFLETNLTLPKLAKTAECSVNHLSQVINSGFGMSFFEYINRFRIEHAKKLLSKLNGRSDAVLNIAFTVGFNSNSAFYAAFKKYVGQTPAQYRRSQFEKSH